MSAKSAVPFNVPQEIARYKLMSSIINLNEYRSLLQDADEESFKMLLKGFSRAIARAVIKQKTFDEKSKAFDLVIPVINNPPALHGLFVSIGFSERDATAVLNKLTDMIDGWPNQVIKAPKTGLLQLKKDSFELKRGPTDKERGAVDRIVNERVITTKLSYIDEGFSISIPIEIYNRLADLFEKHNKSMVDMNFYIFVLWLRYKSITYSSAEHYHWAIENKYINVLAEAGVKTELFASPLNCTFDNYYSLFPDIDQYFGSRGTYIDAFEREELEGIIEANPPFIDSIELDLIKRIESYVDKHHNTYFVLIVSDRDDYESYNLMTKSPCLLVTNPEGLKDPGFVSHMSRGAKISSIPGVTISCFIFGHKGNGKDEDSDEQPSLPRNLSQNSFLIL